MKLRDSEILPLTWLACIGCAALGGALYAIADSADLEPLAWIAYLLGGITGALLAIAVIGAGVMVGVRAARD